MSDSEIMELELDSGKKVSMELSAYYCTPSNFTIGGIDASMYDFGDHHDLHPERMENDDDTRGCGDMQFITDYDKEEKAIQKYGITANEFVLIAEMLETNCSFGHCTLCN